MKVSEIGEFGLIAMITSVINKSSAKNSTARRNLLLGIGDDAAAWKTANSIQLATTDILVEGIHFYLDYTNWRDLGWKALAVNISDIASMGGMPEYALVSLSLPGFIEVADILSLYKGMLQIANEHGIAICGGNISSADKIIINITLTGKASGKKLLKRSTAKPGDLISVTGYPGLSDAGLRVLKTKLRVEPEDRETLIGAHLRPTPKVREGITLVTQGAKTAIDTSDGLLADLAHVCQASRVSAVIYESSLPIHPLLKKYFGAESIKMVLSGGEDYELLFTATPELMDKVKGNLGCLTTVIGEIIAGSPGVVSVRSTTGKTIRPDHKGWDHYKPSS